MTRYVLIGVLGGVLAVVGCTSTGDTRVQSPALGAAPTRTPWQMHQGLEVTAQNPLGLVQFNCNPGTQHGAVCEYDVATVPDVNDAAWGAAPDGETIALDIGCGGSRVCQAPGGQTCFRYGDFTYFQTLVNIPVNVVVTQFTITFQGMDDGSRVSIYNSLNPNGLVIPGSYVFLGGSGTTNLKDYVVAGEVNRVVITQVDDCCCENHLHRAAVVLNGDEVKSGCGGPADCNDNDACTQDVCNQDGTCSHPGVSCDDGSACTVDSCNAQMGCVHAAVSCDDGNACTADSCDANKGCGHEAVVCNDGSLCTTDSCDPGKGCLYAPVSCDDGNACTVDTCNAETGCRSVNQCPDCSAGAATVATLWPPNHKLVSLGVIGVTDPQGQMTTITIDGIAQDEPTNDLGDGNTCPDADGVGTSVAWVRAERTGVKAIPGNGRVYHIAYTATDPDGYTCRGEVTSCVPHDMGKGSVCVDDGPKYDSLVCQ